MGLLDMIGAGLDQPWEAGGVTPEQISTNPWVRRGAVVSALGSQIIPAWEGGHRGFFPSIMAYGQAAQQRESAGQDQAMQIQKHQLAMEAAQAELQQRDALARMFAEPQQGPQAGPGAAIGAPGLGPPGPTQQRASAASQPQTPQQHKAEQYRRAAYMVSARSPETAQKYMELADKLDPKDEYFAPTETATGFTQFSKQGNARPVSGVMPKPPELPGDVRTLEHITGQGLGGTGAQGIAMLKDLNASKAPRTQVNVSTKGDLAFAEQLAGDRAKLLAEQYPQAQQAAGIIGGLNTVINLAEKGTFSGPLAPGAIGAAQFMQSIGVPVAPETLVSSRLTEAVINDLILQTVSANGGARGFTAQEMPLIYNALPRLADDPQSRVAIARLLQRKNTERIQRYQALREQSKGLPLFDKFGTPEVGIPSTTPANRPSLSDIFGR